MLDHLRVSFLRASHPVASQFPFVDYWWLSIGLAIFLLILFILDTDSQPRPARLEAVRWLGITGTFALGFCSKGAAKSEISAQEGYDDHDECAAPSPCCRQS